ncbi:Alpha/Beta hydrolase protein [Pilobolus umbonatus]|nr:Alpha/Beta hydrolase protein [Pilobolus umbonatus]
MLEFIKILLCALVITIAITKNGRDLFTHLLRKSVPLIPYSIRKYNYLGCIYLPLPLNRYLFHCLFRPYGIENNMLSSIQKESWKGYWIVNSDDRVCLQEPSEHFDLVLFFIHGGGFVLGSSTMYMETYQLILNQLKDKYNVKGAILSVEYSLSPDHVWPTATKECLAAYQYLVYEVSMPSQKIVIMGDSAGGNLVATTLLQLKNQRSINELKEMPPLPMPSSAVLISPWLDIRLNKSEFEPYKSADMLQPQQLELFISNYLPDLNSMTDQQRSMRLSDPYLSPATGDYTGICPLYIAYGGAEILRVQIEPFIERVKGQCDVTVHKGHNQVHDWLMHPIMAPSYQVFHEDCSQIIHWISKMIK